MEYVRNTETNKCYKINRECSKVEVVITEEEYRNNDTASIGSIVSTKRIYGECPKEIYAQFIKRAKSEGLEPDAAFRAIITAYALGATIVVHKEKKQYVNHYLQK